MIPGRNYVSSEIEKFISDSRRKTKTTSSIFTIDDEEIDLALFNNMAQVLAHNATARASEDITNKKNAQNKPQLQHKKL